MIKKIIYSIIAILLIFFLIFTYMQMTGNTTHKGKAKDSLELFLDKKHPEMKYKIKKSFEYGWTDATYKFTIVTTSPVKATYSFYVSGIEPYEVFSDTISGSPIDQENEK